jgi:hypothetical protein
MTWFRKHRMIRRDGKPLEVCDMACRADAALQRLRDKQAMDGVRFR